MNATRNWPVFTPDQDPLDVLIGLSRYYGGNPEFVLAGGGNTSYKTEHRLFVKASGAALADIGRDGFVEMSRSSLKALPAQDLGSDVEHRERRFKQHVLAARAEPDQDRRPSVECVLHHILPRRFVVHTHPTVVNMLTCAQNGRALAEQLFGPQVLWVPYVDPGFVLAATLHRILNEHARKTARDCPDAILIQNHGLIVAADTPDDIRRHTDGVVDRVRARLDAAPDEPPFGPITTLPPDRARKLINIIAPALRALTADGDRLNVVTFDDSNPVVSLAGAERGQAVVAGGPLTPDQIVYCKSFPLWFDPGAETSPESVVEQLRRAVRDHEAATGFGPLVVLVRGLGLFAVGRDFAAADTVRLIYTDAIKVMAGAARLGGIQYLTEPQRRFIEHWEAESYRRQVAAAETAAGRAAGKVAVVTGAAQGFGKQIAEDLAAQGAHVALTDIKRDALAEAAESLQQSHGPRRAVALPIDVADTRSVAEAIHQVVRTYGGFDLLVSNAGVLRAESVKTQSEGEFAFVTDVNYKGYFLCVKHAAPILAVQRLAKPDYWSDIIQINSKSGLVGSNRNAAYAGSKFGGIGLTQSFALELVDDGIKVNAICPGNFFDGPLWSDPENGLFVQYLRTGKVPGAKTVQDVRAAYEAKIPMGRGCTTADVVKAIYYLMEQQYETGQALPVTGGQVMLR